MLRSLLALLSIAIALRSDVRADDYKVESNLPRYAVESKLPTAPAPKAKGCECGPGCDCPAGSCPAACKPAAPADPLWFALRVSVDYGGGSGGSGSGTPVYSGGGKTLVLTNAHVVPRSDANRPITVHAGGKAYPARYVDGSEVSSTGPGTIAVHGADLCLLEISAEIGAVGVASEPPAVGELVSQWGYGGVQPGRPPVLRQGAVLAGANYVEPTLVTGIRSVSGDSGAGVFNARGELVGVTWGGDGATHRGVPLATVKAWLTRPRLRGLFPRLAERLDARREARETPKGVPAEPVSPDSLDVPAKMPPADARRWQINGQGSYTSDEVRARGLRVPGDPDCPGGVCPLRPAAPPAGPCPTGKCPTAR